MKSLVYIFIFLQLSVLLCRGSNKYFIGYETFYLPFPDNGDLNYKVYYETRKKFLGITYKKEGHYVTFKDCYYINSGYNHDGVSMFKCIESNDEKYRNFVITIPSDNNPLDELNKKIIKEAESDPKREQYFNFIRDFYSFGRIYLNSAILYNDDDSISYQICDENAKNLGSNKKKFSIKITADYRYVLINNITYRPDTVDEYQKQYTLEFPFHYNNITFNV
ncbi:hypothetical protein PIROE2DRAFT_16795 [Piromyces sp. E2]|nr:hypothetical protein PIROE2DRAFT_16795 [Piromyces sp. E2]|eukprot:OUM58036.1 hypothetical protein PIROE2DRAFT_16795 [Piromyces sp. E2]